jgi:hypothetical protein
MPNVDFSKIATLKYWLEGTTAGADVNILPVEFNSFYYYFYISVFSGFLILAIGIMVYKLFLPSAHPLQNKIGFLSQNLVWMGILGVGWFLARQTSISFLSARLWLIFGFIWLLAVLFWFFRYLITFYPLELAFYKKQKSEVKSNKK